MFPEGRALEFLIAATVALIVVGPKDLPVLLRRLGQFMAKVRSMAAEFRASFDEMARQSELDDLRKEVEAMRQGQLSDIATHTPEVNQAFDEISQGLSDVGVSFNSPAYTPAQTAHIEEPPARAPRARKTSAKKAPAKNTPVKTAAAKKTAAPKAAAPKSAAPKSAAPKSAAPKSAAKPKAAAPKPAVKPKAPAAKTGPAKPSTRKAAAS
jgi:sec-independent protein translocase protein TatB